MTNDELLSGFLDRTLNEDQILEFQARREAQPEFDQQVQAMLRVEQALPIASPSISTPVALFETVEATAIHHIAQHVGSQVVVGGSAGALSSALSRIATSAWTYATIMGISAVGAGIAYISNVDTRPTSANSVITIQSPGSAQPVVLRLSVPQDELLAPTTVHHIPSMRDLQAPWTTAADVPKFSHRSAQGTHRIDVQMESSDPALESLLRDFDKSSADADIVRRAQLGLAIGRTYRERGQFQLAERFLGTSLVDARKSRIVEYEVEVLTELALSALTAGHRTDAAEYAQKAQTVAERAGISYQPVDLLDPRE